VTIDVYVGTEPKQASAERALERSIRANTEADVDIHWMRAGEGEFAGWHRGATDWGTGFSCFRFAAAAHHAAGGDIIYLDADMLVLGDIAELLAHGSGGGYRSVVGRSDVAVIDAARVAKALPTIDQMRAGSFTWTDYRRVLAKSRLWLSNLPSEWECLDGWGYRPGYTKLLHFTHQPTQPWLASSVPHPNPEVVDLWKGYYDAR
jgi:hypothetical protein